MIVTFMLEMCTLFKGSNSTSGRGYRDMRRVVVSWDGPAEGRSQVVCEIHTIICIREVVKLCARCGSE